MPFDFWLPPLLLAAFFGFWFVLIVIACLLETRPVQPYYVPEPGDEYEPSELAKDANFDAEELGYHHGGLCHDGKGKIYRIRYDFWLAPDSSTVAVVSSGTIARLPTSGIWLWSRRTDGRIVCTTNEIGSQDVSGIVDQQTWQNATFPVLVNRHEPRVGEEFEPFPADGPLAGFFDIRRQIADALVARGRAYYRDDDHKAWRYTLKGAVVFYFVACWVRPLQRRLRSIGLARD